MSTIEGAKKVSKKTTKNLKKVESEQPAAEPVKVEAVKQEAEKPKKEKKAKKLPSPKELSVAEAAPEQPAPESEPVVEQAADESKSDEKLSRKKKNYNQLVSEVDHLNQLVEKYVVEHKETKNSEMSRFLKSLEKGLKKVRFQIQKIGKTKGSSSGSSSNVQSGFQKPVRISEAVARFTGWDVSEARARVEVTNFVCDYIKRNNLQSPTDKRVILADANLKDLLDYQSERDGDLTYATIQKLLAKHYSPVVAAASS